MDILRWIELLCWILMVRRVENQSNARASSQKIGCQRWVGEVKVVDRNKERWSRGWLHQVHDLVHLMKMKVCITWSNTKWKHQWEVRHSMINKWKRLMIQSWSSQLLLATYLLRQQAVEILNSSPNLISDSTANFDLASRMEQIGSTSSSRIKNNQQELRPQHIQIELQYYQSKSCHKTTAAKVPSLSHWQEKAMTSKVRTA